MCDYRSPNCDCDRKPDKKEEDYDWELGCWVGDDDNSSAYPYDDDDWDGIG